jgi:hypothetical protein
MGQIARAVGAYLLADIAHIAGLVAAGLHPSPVPHADFVTTTTHKTLRGPRGGLILCGEEHAKAIDSQMFPGIQGGPLMHVIAAKAVCLQEALQPSFRQYQQQVLHNAQALAEGMARNGFRLVSGGTDNHLMLVDVGARGVSGKECQAALDLAGITVNKNTIPFETRSPFQASGIRLGTPAVTTRGMEQPEMAAIADMISEVLLDLKTPRLSNRCVSVSANLPRSFPCRDEPVNPAPARKRLSQASSFGSFRLFIDDQHSVWWQIVITLEIAAGQEIVDRFVEVDADRGRLMVEEEIGAALAALAEADLDGIGHLEQREEVAELPQPHDQVVVEMLVAHGAEVDGLAQAEGVHGHDRPPGIKILGVGGQDLAAARLDEIAPVARRMQVTGGEGPFEHQVVLLPGGNGSNSSTSNPNTSVRSCG